MDFTYLIVRTERRVGWLEYNRPPINAVHWDMLYELPKALRVLIDDPGVRVIVIASALEKHFSVGADLSVFEGIDAEGMRRWVGYTHEMVRQARSSPKPLLAAIHGTAVGGGLEWAMHCDQRFAATDARLGQPEVHINLLPPVGTTQSLARLLGRTRALRFLFDGEMVSAEEAQALGLVDVLVEPGRLREEVQAYGEKLAARPPEALAAIRSTITHGGDLPFDEGLTLELEAEVALAETDNFREGIRAFMEKRKPMWR